nr:hypothetical protein [Citrobacter freundii]
MSGFATTDLSVKFCDACQGGEAYGKTPWSGMALSFLFWLFVTLTVYVICLLGRCVRSPQISDRA